MQLTPNLMYLLSIPSVSTTTAVKTTEFRFVERHLLLFHLIFISFSKNALPAAIAI